MDLLKYINSNAKREYLRQINYKFNVMEAICIVEHAFGVSFEEKKVALYDIIDNFPDMPYDKTVNGYTFNSLHQVIIEYIALMEKNYKEFISNDGSYYYTFTTFYHSKAFEEPTIAFKDYESAIMYITKNIVSPYKSINGIYFANSKTNFDSVVIEKKKYGTDKLIGRIILNSRLEHEYLSFRGNSDYTSREYTLMYDLFYNMSIDLPLHKIISYDVVRKNNDILEEDKMENVNIEINKDSGEHIKLWLDDVRTAPEGFYHCHSVNEMKKKILECEEKGVKIDLLDLDHDLGEYAGDGGDGIKLVDWLAENEKYYKINLHTMNPIGRENMQREIDHYWP